MERADETGDAELRPSPGRARGLGTRARARRGPPGALEVGLAWLLVACTTRADSTSGDAGADGGGGVPPPIDVAFEQVLDAFDADPIPTPPDVFAMMLGDLDLDGDLDFVLNRHNKARMELFENVGGSFAQLNRKGLDRSGVWENPGVADLYEDSAVMLDRVAAFGAPGTYLWHELVTTTGRWWFHLAPDERGSPQPLRIVSNGALQTIDLPPGAYTRIDERTLDVHPEDPSVPTTFALKCKGSQLVVQGTAPDPATIYVGTSFTAFHDGRAEIWQRDPHGMALVDATGSAYPDLTLTHGGQTGNLVPPLDPKTDQLFAYVGAATTFAEVPAGTLPANYGRGRQVVWMDVDADGAPELYTGNRETPNTLFDRGADGTFVDRAPALGLDLVAPESFAWVDLDDDGRLDLVFLDGQVPGVALQRAGGRFDVRPGSEFGLVLPPDLDDPVNGIFDPTTLHVLDHDRDGDLDLWITHFDKSARLRVYERDAGTFADVTDALQLGDQGPFIGAAIADVDNDGWLDLLAGPKQSLLGDIGGSDGQRFGWWRNLGGERFEPAPLDDGFQEPTSNQLAVGDVDGDGWIDVVLVTKDRRQLLRNTSSGPNTLLEVRPNLPLGAVVRGYYADGSVQAQQWGAATTYRFAQSLQPLRFGMGPKDRVLEVGVQLPGDPTERYRVRVRAGTTDLNL